MKSILNLYILVMNKKINLSRKNLRCFDRKMNNHEKNLYFKLIKLVVNVLEKNNIKWIPTSGNLLAIYRYNKLFNQWDDDFDIVIEEKYANKVMDILKKELPNYIGYSKRKWDSKGFINKIFFKETYSPHVYPTNFLPEENKPNLTWPFIDIFINTKNNYNWNTTHNLKYSEFPLKVKKINGIKVYIPTNGIRNYNNFKRKKILENCEHQNYSHKYQLHIKCIGKSKKKCKDIKLR